MILQSEKVVLFIQTVNEFLKHPTAVQKLAQYRGFYTKVGKVVGAPNMIEAIELAAHEQELEKMEFKFEREVTLQEAVDAVITQLKELKESRNDV